MPEESEISKTARQIDELDKAVRERKNQIEVMKNQNARDADTLNNLSLKLKQLVSQFSYGQLQTQEDNSEKHIADRTELQKNLGPVVITGHGASVRQKILEWAVGLPYLDRPPTIRYLMGCGYAQGSASVLYKVLTGHLISKGWHKDELGHLVKPKSFQLDLKTATPSERESFLKQVNNES
jgi:hypothetical protein